MCEATPQNFAWQFVPAWAQPAYDGAGNMTTIPQPADPTESYTATYDAWNRLMQLVDPATGHTVQENEYDGRGFRTVRKSYTAGVLSETRHLYYTDGWRDVEERLGTSPDTADPDRQFVWGVRYIDDLVLRDRSAAGTLDERLYALQDANWNITAVVDDAGDVQERYEYDPYGQLTVLSPGFVVREASSFRWETTYAGYQFDTVTGLYAVRFRVFAPTLGWAQRDPAGYASSQNQHMYTATSPLTSVDPSGLDDFNIAQNTEAFNTVYINNTSFYFEASSAVGWWAFLGRNPAVRNCPSFGNDWGPSDGGVWAIGCWGVTSTYIGRNINSNSQRQNCYAQFNQARAVQQAMNCEGQNCQGQPARARIFVYAWQDHVSSHSGLAEQNRSDFSLNPETGLMTWGGYGETEGPSVRYDTLVFDDSAQMWYGMQDAGGSYVEVPHSSLRAYLGPGAAFSHGYATAPPPGDPAAGPFHLGLGSGGPRGRYRWLRVFCVVCESNNPEVR